MADITCSSGVEKRPGIVHLALALGGFAIGTAEFAAMSLVPYFSPDLGISEAVASHVISAYALGVVIGAPVLAVMGARLPRRTLLIALMLFYGVVNLLSAFAANYEQMLAMRFMAGLPHGAYFGVAALMAASLVPSHQRSQAMARVMIGLTVATVLGVPFANVLGQTVGWRFGFGMVGILAAVTALLIFLHAPREAVRRTASPLSELSALANRQVLLTLLTGAIGFGGFFAVYTYVASILIRVTEASQTAEPIVLGVIGVGMTLGTLAAGWATDRAPALTGYVILGGSVVLMLIYPSTVHSLWLMVPVLFLIGMTGSMGTVLQSRLADVAGDAQTMAAAMNHSAFNAANALGPALAAASISAGYGLPSSGYVGAALGVAGLVCFTITLWDAKRSARPAR
ncbi:MFS transporter [Cereibacter sp. SYSU M97828]|nr:MFS transporter [Cereibacter flavus]